MLTKNMIKISEIEEWMYAHSINDDYKDMENQIKSLIVMANNTELYRWHNLKENKFDLPKQYELVLCDTVRDGYMIMYIKENQWIDNIDDSIYTNAYKSRGINGWKYIEEFETEISTI